MPYLFKILFGLSLLLGLSGSAAAATAQDSSFTIEPGDVLQITVWKEDGLDRETLILPDGTFTFPLVGTLKAQGATPQGLQTIIKKSLAPFIPDASVTVTVKAPLGHTVNVLGQVVKPGELIMQGRMSVMQALSQAGGLTPYADEGDIIVLRRENGEKKSIDYPYDDIVQGDDLEKDIDLKPGDVIVVPTAGLF